ncbi:MAG: hypothetical protein ACRECF_10435, partial [Methyloceanibacter sp.]
MTLAPASRSGRHHRVTRAGKQEDLDRLERGDGLGLEGQHGAHRRVLPTGVPKGVRLAHRGVANLVAWEEKTYGITPQDRG